MSAVIELANLTKFYRGRKALDNISIKVEPGQVFAILGDNGAGKTTAIRTLLGLVRPDSGRASVMGLDAAVFGRQIRQRIGYVPEQPTLYDWMTVEEIGWFTAGLNGPGFLDNFKRHATHFKLPPRAKIGQLSKGMKAKVSLSLALAREPELLLLDEPTSGLDIVVRREFLESMVDVAATGRTVFLSSHQISEVERVADTVAILVQGKLLLCEKLETIKEEVRELMMVGTIDSSFVWPGEIIEQETIGPQTRLVLRAMPHVELDLAAREAGAEHVDIRHPDLESIFIAYLKGNAQPAMTGSAVQ